MATHQIMITVAILATIYIVAITYILLFKSHETRYSKRLTFEGWNYYKYSFQCQNPISKSDYIEGKSTEKETRKKLRNT